jgi:hypothetical protein
MHDLHGIDRVKKPQDIAMAIENVVTVWFQWTGGAVVPFSQLAYTYLLLPIINILRNSMWQLVFGPNRMPLRYVQQISALAQFGNLAGQLK